MPVPHVVGNRALERRLVARSKADPVGELYAAARVSGRADSLAIRAVVALPILGHGLCKNARANAMVVRTREDRSQGAIAIVSSRRRGRMAWAWSASGVSRSEPLSYSSRRRYDALGGDAARGAHRGRGEPLALWRTGGCHRAHSAGRT